jgi:TonB family protein
MFALVIIALAVGGAPQQNLAAEWPSCPTVKGRAVYSVLAISVDAEGKVSGTEALAGDPAFLEQAAQAARSVTLPQPLSGSRFGLFCTTDATARLGYLFDTAQLKGERRPPDISPALAEQNLVSRVQPDYPPVAKSRYIQGEVALEAVVGANGKIAALIPLSGPLELRHAAVEAARQWSYRPFAISGRPVAVDTTVSVRFVRNR